MESGRKIAWFMYVAPIYLYENNLKIAIIDGGNDPDKSIGCSGGSRRIDCFSSRFMWRQLSEGELYVSLRSSLFADLLI